MKFCQTILWNSDHENDVLPVCFVRTRVWKVKSCQFKLQILYCTTVVLLGKLFRLKLCLWLNSVCFVKLLCRFDFGQLVYFLQPLRVLPSSASVSGGRVGVSSAPFCAVVNVPHLGAGRVRLLSVRVHLGVCPFLLSMSVASLCGPLGLNSAWQWSLNIALILLRISPVDWTNFWPKTATFEILINDKFLPELPSLAALIETQITSNETWAWQYQTASTELMRTNLSSIFTNWDKLRRRKLSFSYISNFLNRGTDLNRLLISLSHYLKYSNNL